jgi:hypothetical protein
LSAILWIILVAASVFGQAGECDCHYHSAVGARGKTLSPASDQNALALKFAPIDSSFDSWIHLLSFDVVELFGRRSNNNFVAHPTIHESAHQVPGEHLVWEFVLGCLTSPSTATPLPVSLGAVE